MKKQVAIISAAAFLGITSASTYSLWHDQVEAPLSYKLGYVAFGVGDPSGSNIDYVKTNSEASTFRIDGADSKALNEKGEIAIPIQVTGSRQGSGGLKYEIDMPAFDQGLFSKSTNTLTKVSSPSECNTSVRTNDYATADKVLYEADEYQTDNSTKEAYYCFVARLPSNTVGTYTNNAFAMGDDLRTNELVYAQDQWKVNLSDRPITSEDAPDTAVHDIKFTPEFPFYPSN